MSKIVTLLSGGLDSAVLLWWLKSQGNEVTAIAFNYGQRHIRELDHARELFRISGIADLIVVDMPSVGRNLQGSSQTDMRVDVPEGHYAADNMKTTIVPNRNMIMLSIAAGIAMSRGIKAVAFAAHAGDHAIYPDCCGVFKLQFELALNAAMGCEDFGVAAPFINMPKQAIVTIGAKLGVPFEKTWSCYKGLDLHCGKCGTCVERREAFALAGVKDPTIYVDTPEEVLL